MQFERRDSAILATDVVGYVRLMSRDEIGTHARLMKARAQVLDPRIAAYGGTIIKNTGDGFLAVFGSINDAVDCALAMQRALAEAEPDVAPEERINMRMGINFGSIIYDEGDIYGDAVNAAARLQTYAEPGAIAIPAELAAAITGRGDIDKADLGDLYLHNRDRPIRTYTLRLRDGRPELVATGYPGSEGQSSIAVLPFRRARGDTQETYFAEGIVEDIIFALSGLKDLLVISRTSTLSFGGDIVDPRAIGRSLNVQYVLSGSVRHAGDSLRITTELSETEAGRVIRVDRYDGDLSDLFALQDRISTSVVSTIAPHVRERELQRALRKHPQNMTAYDLMLQALALLHKLDDESFARARGLLQKAIAHDPHYGPAYSYAAFWHVLQIGEGRSSDARADAAEGGRLASIAIRLNETDPLALAVFGHVQSFMFRNYARATVYLDRAIEAGPSSAIAWTMNSATCGYLGQGELAIERAQRGLRLAPQDAYRFWHEAILAQAFYVSGRFEEAVTWSRRALGREGAVIFAWRILIASLIASGDRPAGQDAARRMMEVKPAFRLTPYQELCPFQGDTLTTWMERLREAGLPD